MTAGTRLPDPTEVRLDGATLPSRLLARARERKDAVAFAQKRRGTWLTHTWAQYVDDVSRVGRALLHLGLATGDRVAIMGDVSREWLLADMGAVCAGGVSVGVYFTSSPTEVEYVVRDCGAAFLFVGAQPQLETALKADALRTVRRIVVMDPEWVAGASSSAIMSFAELLGLGDTLPASAFEAAAAAVRPDDLASIGYTSGTTGPPKGAMLTHRALLYGALSTVVISPDLLRGPHRVVVHLPLSHIVAKAQAVTVPLIANLVPHFGETTAKFAETIVDARPTWYLGPPRFYQKFAAQLISDVQAGPPGRRRTYAAAMRVARAVLRRRRARRPLGPALAVLHALAVRLVFRPLVAKVGFDAVSLPYTASAAMPGEVMMLWQLWGLNLKEAYGQTEMAGGNVAQMEDWSAPGTIGVPIPHPAWETKVLADGEMILRSPALFVGYWNKPEETASALRDGWLYTGDIVTAQPDGSFKLIDRKKEIINTAAGKSVSPTTIENELRHSPYISEAAVVGEGRKYLGALIEVDASTLGEWAKAHGVAVSSYAGFAESDAVRKLIEGEVAKANDRLARVEQIKVFRILPEELSPELGVMTPTRKKKRKPLQERYAALIDSMFDTAEDDLIARQVAR